MRAADGVEEERVSVGFGCEGCFWYLDRLGWVGVFLRSLFEMIFEENGSRLATCCTVFELKILKGQNGRFGRSKYRLCFR